MKSIKYPIIALALLATSCQKSDSNTNAGTEAVTFTISGDLSTRATLVESWSVGDRIGISDIDNGPQNAEYTVSEVDNFGAATLSATSPITITRSDDEEAVYFAYYPYSEDFEDDMLLDLTNQVDLMVSGFVITTDTEIDFTFSHVYSYLSITLEFMDEFVDELGLDSVDDIESSDVEIYIKGYSQGKLLAEEDNLDELYVSPTGLVYDEDIIFEQSITDGVLSANAMILPLDYNDYDDALVCFRFYDVDGNRLSSTQKLSDIIKNTDGEDDGVANSGYKYSYTATVGREEVSFKSSDSDNITDWKNEDVDQCK